MTASPDMPADLSWYRSRWEQLMNLLSVSDPEAVPEKVRALQERTQTLEAERESLAEAGLDDPEEAPQMIKNMERQLRELYAEKESAEHAQEQDRDWSQENTFEQLRRFHAFQNELERELGLSSVEDVLAMIESLTAQLETVYRRREEEAEDSSPASSFEHKLEAELGLSDTDAVLSLGRDLIRQIDQLSNTRRRLSRLNFYDPGYVAETVASMERQLNTLHERQERLSDQGIDSVDQTLGMIEDLEAQLNELYEARHLLAEKHFDDPQDATERFDKMATRLQLLAEQKEKLQDCRKTLESELEALNLPVDPDDPTALPQLIRTIEERLRTVFDDRPPHAPQVVHSAVGPLVSDDEREQLEEMSAEELNALSAGAFCMNDAGDVQRANEQALEWPSVSASTPEALKGRNFFTDLAPDADTPLFRGRFEEGAETGAMNIQFLYRSTQEEDAPTELAVHLHRKPHRSVNWILFQPR